MIVMTHAPLESTFSNEGGSIRFAGLGAQVGPDFTSESMDLAGTLEWTCEAASGRASERSSAETELGYR